MDPAQDSPRCTRLRSYGVPDDLRSPASIVQRLARVLGGRPLLAPSPADLDAIRTTLTLIEHAVVAADTVMRGVRAGLANAPTHA